MMTNATMTTKWMPAIRAVGFSLALGLLLVLGAAFTHAEETQPATQKQEPEAAPTDSTVGPVEGLRVHGHWTIEVRDPDGTLVERREFENALLIGQGDGHLANVLGRVRTFGGWVIQLHPDATAGICDSGGNPINCDVVESTNPASTTNTFKTLTVAVSGGQTELSGTAVAQRDGNIGVVKTLNLYCGSAVSPDSCPGDLSATFVDFTATTLLTPVSVLNGQQVQVTVIISFS